VDVVIRDAVPADVAAACNLVRRSITELCAADHKGDETTIAAWLANKTEGNFAAWICSPGRVAIVAERAGAIVGFALLNRDGTIALLYVAPEAQFTGVSKAMLAVLEEYAVASRITELKLESSVTALSFYESCGYSQVGGTAQGFGVTRAYPLCKRIAR
jgi:GNAT superfamily N-acetyltransferase